MVDLYSIFDSLSVVVFVHDASTGDVLYINNACQEMYGYSPSELTEKGLVIISASEPDYNFDRALELIHKAAKGDPQKFEWRTANKNGDKFWVEVTLKATTIDNDTRVVATVNDITKVREARERLERREHYLKTINDIIQVIFPLKDEEDVLWSAVESCGKALELPDIIIYLKTPEGKLMQAAAYGDKNIKDRQIQNPIVLSMDEGIVGSVARNKSHEIVNDVSKDLRYVTDLDTGGSEIAVPILFQDNLLGVIDSEHPEKGYFHDFHLESLKTVASLIGIKIAQSRSDKNERLNQERTDAILNSNPDLVFLLSEDGHYKEIYTKNDHMLAAPRKELLGSLIDDYVDKGELKRIKSMLKEVAKDGFSTPLEFKRKSLDGKERWFLTNAARLNFRGENTVLLMSRDITERKEIQKRVEERERLLVSINKNISDGIYRSRPDDKFIYVNEAFVKLFGYESQEELLSVKPHDLYAHPEERSKVVDILTEDNKMKNQIFEFRRKDGSTFWGAMSSILTDDTDGRPIFDGAVRDITEQREAQKQIEESEKILSSINHNISEGLYRSYAKGGLIYVNEAFAKMFGYESPDDILNVESLQLYADPTDRKGVTPEVLQKGYRSNVETLFRRKDGSIFWGMNSFVLTTDHEGNEVFDGAVRDISIEKDAAEKLNKLNNELLERNKILALKEQELESSNEELRSNSESLVQTLNELSDRNFELDQLVYKTSHDLRSPLRSVLGLTNLMKAQGISFEDDYILKIEERILKMDDFIKDMLNYSRASRMDVTSEKVNLDELIDSCISDLEYLEGFDNLNIIKCYNGSQIEVDTDLLRNRIIFGNIISNAFKYRNLEINDSYLKITINTFDSRYEVIFEDNGIGISNEYIEHVFEMFFRATEKSDGSGLGMYIVKQCVDKLHGDIVVESELGKGTKIKLDIPL